MNGIIIGGVVYPVKASNGQDVPVRRWNDGQLPAVPEFKPGDGYNKKRTKPIDLFVFHWTGGENEPIVMAATLRKRDLGVEFAISRGGTIYQYCDPAVVDTADAGIVNSRSAGCEIISYGMPGLMGPPKLGADRGVYIATTHGKAAKTARFYPVQIQAAIALAEAFSKAVPAVQRRVPDAELQTEMPRALLDQFKGFVGHYHITANKRDPGPELIDALRFAFAAKGVA
jgi:hypothetical protein